MDHYAVFGNPVGHSLSPKIHHLFAQQTEQALTYDAIYTPLDSFAETIQKFLEQGGKGFNVTLPFKQHAYGLADELKPRAQLAQAVNTMGITDGKLWGDNTDGAGLVRDLIENNSVQLEHATILIIGAGGAVRGVLGPLLEQNPKKITIVNRTASTAQTLVEIFKELGTITATTFDELSEPFDLIINGSSASLKGELLPLPTAVIAPHHTSCYDMMYGATRTPFNQWAKTQQAKNSLDGLGMLVEQAAEAFYLWRNIQPKTAEVIAELRAVIHAQKKP